MTARLFCALLCLHLPLAAAQALQLSYASLRRRAEAVGVARRMRRDRGPGHEPPATFVELPPAEPKAEPAKKEIKVGLSDGLNTEVLDGLAEGEEVVQRPPKEITGN